MGCTNPAGGDCPFTEEEMMVWVGRVVGTLSIGSTGIRMLIDTAQFTGGVSGNCMGNPEYSCGQDKEVDLAEMVAGGMPWVSPIIFPLSFSATHTQCDFSGNPCTTTNSTVTVDFTPADRVVLQNWRDNCCKCPQILDPVTVTGKWYTQELTVADCFGSYTSPPTTSLPTLCCAYEPANYHPDGGHIVSISISKDGIMVQENNRDDVVFVLCTGPYAPPLYCDEPNNTIEKQDWEGANYGMSEAVIQPSVGEGAMTGTGTFWYKAKGDGSNVFTSGECTFEVTFSERDRSTLSHYWATCYVPPTPIEEDPPP